MKSLFDLTVASVVKLSTIFIGLYFHVGISRTGNGIADGRFLANNPLNKPYLTKRQTHPSLINAA